VGFEQRGGGRGRARDARTGQCRRPGGRARGPVASVGGAGRERCLSGAGPAGPLAHPLRLAQLGGGEVLQRAQLLDGAFPRYVND
jgi:hypothetical protein